MRRFYVKGRDEHGNTSQDDYLIQFCRPDTFVPYTFEIEAEKGKLSGTMSVVKDPKVSGGQYITAAMGMMGAIRAEYEFTVPCAGAYIVWCRVWGPNSNSDSFYVSVDNGHEDIFDIDEKNRTKNWRWSVLAGRGLYGKRRPVSLEPRILYLTKGEHTLTFRGRESDACLDRLIVTNDLEFKPGG